MSAGFYPQKKLTVENPFLHDRASQNEVSYKFQSEKKPILDTPKALTTGTQIQNTFARAYKAGVKIAFGTNAGVYPHGKNWLEFGYMIGDGMPAMEAIKSARINAADLLGEKIKPGSIDAGKLADIIEIDGYPLKDSKVFGKVVFVMKDGVVCKQ